MGQITQTTSELQNVLDQQEDGNPSSVVGWDDITNPLVARRLESTSGRLQYNWAENTITMQDNGNINSTSDRLIFNLQKPHGMLENGADCEFRLHIHWEQTSTDKVEFTVQYRIQSNNAAKNTTWVTATANSTDDSAFTYPGSGTFNQITRLVDIDMSGVALSSTCQIRLARTDDIGADDIEATFVDAHYPTDQERGSRQEFVK